jgi:hypothetical protein
LSRLPATAVGFAVWALRVGLNLAALERQRVIAESR